MAVPRRLGARCHAAFPGSSSLSSPFSEGSGVRGPPTHISMGSRPDCWQGRSPCRPASLCARPQTSAPLFRAQTSPHNLQPPLGTTPHHLTAPPPPCCSQKTPSQALPALPASLLLLFYYFSLFYFSPTAFFLPAAITGRSLSAAAADLWPCWR